MQGPPRRVHTDPHYEAELAALHGRVLALGGVIERQIRQAKRAYEERDDEVARATIKDDDVADRMDEEIHDLCLRLLALHQPAASDLRFITTTQSITADLERIGDIVCNICERVLELNSEGRLDSPVDIPRMADIAEGMVRRSLDSYDREDVELALAVCRDDDEIDSANEEFFRHLLEDMVQRPEYIARCLRAMFIAKSIERIADHATNIASMVIFMVTGKSIRHHGKFAGKI